MTTQLRFGSGTAIQIDGLDGLQRWLESADPKLRRALDKGLKDAAQPVLERARANASKIADDGTMRGSLSITSRLGGSNPQILLKSKGDPAAGVKEFANPGARYRPSPGDKRRNARKMRSFPVGVPRRAGAPRVMVPAVNDSADEVESHVQRRMEEVLAEARNG